MEMTTASGAGLVKKNDDEWRAILSPEQFKILRGKGDETRGKGEFLKLFDEGIYCCAGCEAPVYKSTTKFDSGCGWPSFFDAIPGAVNRTSEKDGRWFEITCAKCDGHLGMSLKTKAFQRQPTNSIASTAFHSSSLPRIRLKSKPIRFGFWESILKT